MRSKGETGRGRRSGRVARSGAVGADGDVQHDDLVVGAYDGEIAGYRLVRRMATGERAAVYLATVDGAAAGLPGADDVRRPGSAFAPPGDRAVPEPTPTPEAPPEPVALRLYGPRADPGAITLELEALAADGGRTLPAPYDFASLSDGRVCLVVERIAGERLSKLLGERSLTAGEAVTVLAPLAAVVRRLAEAGFVHTRLAASDVLFDASGRPRLLGLGALARLEGLSAVERSAVLRDGHAALGRLVAEVVSAVRPPSSFARALELASAGLDARPFRPFALELEQVLFELAAPEPLREAGRGGAGIRSQIVPPPVVGGAGPASSADRATTAPGPAAAMPGSASLRAPEGVAGYAASVDRAGPRDRARSRDRGGARDRAAAVGSAASGNGGARAGGGARPDDELGLADEAQPDASRSLLAHEAPLLAVLQWSRLRSVVRSTVGRRRAPLIVAALGGGAALVVMLALVPPGGPGERALAQDAPSVEVAGEAVGTATAGAEPAGDPSAGAGEGPGAESGAESGADADSGPGESIDAAADPAVVAAELLELRASCFAAADRDCLAAVVQPGSALEADDLAAIAREPGDRPELVRYDLSAITVQGTMGQAVLLNVPAEDAERQPASLLMVRSEAGWRLRELFG